VSAPERDDFFYIQQGNYDNIAELSLPHYHEAHELIAMILKERGGTVRSALDLGAGSGQTALTVLRAAHGTQLTAVDLFPEMLADARRRLESFGSRVQFVESDNTAFLTSSPRRFDVITSAFCLHHLSRTGKQEIFKLIFEALNPGGVFLLLDLTTFTDPTLQKISRRSTEHYMLGRVQDERVRAEWIHHWNEVNTPDPADSQVGWMADVGFQAETVCRWLEVALVAATRPTDVNDRT